MKKVDLAAHVESDLQPANIVADCVETTQDCAAWRRLVKTATLYPAGARTLIDCIDALDLHLYCSIYLVQAIISKIKKTFKQIRKSLDSHNR